MGVTKNLPFLDQRIAIVDDAGRPTPQFMRWFQENLGNVNYAASTAEGSVQSSRRIDTNGGLQGGGDFSADRTFSLTDTGIAPGSYGTSSKVPRFTVDVKGRVTAVIEVDIAGGAGGGAFTFDGGNAGMVWPAVGVFKADLGGAT